MKLNNKKDILKYNIENMSKVPFGVKSVLNNPSLKGIEGTIGSLINTELSYSEAINTALQASANNIVDN